MVRMLEYREIADFLDKEMKQLYNHEIDLLKKINLSDILSEYNPYLCSIRNWNVAGTFIRDRLDASLSPLEEDLLYNLLVNLAFFICSNVYDGKKSSSPGLDLEFTKEGITYIVTIKSGPNWANGRAKSKMKNDFERAIKTLKTSGSKLHIVAIEGCCYGKDNKPEKGSYQKLCGQRFWEFISGNEKLYTDIIDPLGHKAKEKNEKFIESYAQIINKFTHQFMNDFCDDGKINWEELVKFNSGKETIRRKRKNKK